MHVKGDPEDSVYTVHTSLLFDSKKKTFGKDISLTVSIESGLIIGVKTRDASTPLQLGPNDMDLRGLTVLPGLVDSHTHIFLHAYSETPSINQERDESVPERILRASNHLRAALKAGYTTYRDLGTEGMGDLDVGVRDAVNRGIIPGPRLFVATDPLASSSGYEVRIEGRSQGTTTTRISDPCDGIEGVTAGVRRRLGAGADIIKFYADYRKRALRFPTQNWPGSRPMAHAPEGFDRNPNCPLFNSSEMEAIVIEARRSKCPVAAHAQDPDVVIEASNAGVTTLEHGFVRSDAAIEALKQNDTLWVPTLSVIAAEIGGKILDESLEQLKAGWKKGVRIACGGDTGAIAHGENAMELELFEKAGVSCEDILKSATYRGWEACGGDWCGRRFGWLGQDWAADLVAVEGDPRKVGMSCMRKVKCVVKDGRVVVRDGQLVD